MQPLRGATSYTDEHTVERQNLATFTCEVYLFARKNYLENRNTGAEPHGIQDAGSEQQDKRFPSGQERQHDNLLLRKGGVGDDHVVLHTIDL